MSRRSLSLRCVLDRFYDCNNFFSLHFFQRADLCRFACRRLGRSDEREISSIRLCGSIFRGRNREKKKKKKERMRTNFVSLRVALSREKEREEEEDSARVVRFLRREERK